MMPRIIMPSDALGVFAGGSSVFPDDGTCAII